MNTSPKSGRMNLTCFQTVHLEHLSVHSHM